MKVKELIEELQKQDPEAEVVVVDERYVGEYSPIREVELQEDGSVMIW